MREIMNAEREKKKEPGVACRDNEVHLSPMNPPDTCSSLNTRPISREIIAYSL